MWKQTLSLLAVPFLTQPATAAPCSDAGSLVNARTSAKGRHEFAVFTFKLPADVRWSVEAASPPFMEDPSEAPITVAGSKFTEVTFQGVNWMCEVSEAFHTPRQAIVDVKRSSQFEGNISYIIGRSEASRFISVYSYDTKGNRVVVVKFRR